MLVVVMVLLESRLCRLCMRLWCLYTNNRHRSNASFAIAVSRPLPLFLLDMLINDMINLSLSLSLSLSL